MTEEDSVYKRMRKEQGNNGEVMRRKPRSIQKQGERDKLSTAGLYQGALYDDYKALDPLPWALVCTCMYGFFCNCYLQVISTNDLLHENNQAI